MREQYQKYTSLITSLIIFIGSLYIIIRDIKYNAQYASGYLWPFSIFWLVALFFHVLFLIADLDQVPLIISSVSYILAWIYSITCLASFSHFPSTSIIQYLPFMPSFILVCIIGLSLTRCCSDQEGQPRQQQQQAQYGPVVIELEQDVHA